MALLLGIVAIVEDFLVIVCAFSHKLVTVAELGTSLLQVLPSTYPLG